MSARKNGWLGSITVRHVTTVTKLESAVGRACRETGKPPHHRPGQVNGRRPGAIEATGLVFCVLVMLLVLWLALAFAHWGARFLSLSLSLLTSR
jgi:hypothetical protein